MYRSYLIIAGDATILPLMYNDLDNYCARPVTGIARELRGLAHSE